MGACEITTTAVAETAEKAWKEIVKEAYEKYGHDGYNGTFSTCTFGYVAKKFDGKATKSNIEAARKIAVKMFDKNEIVKCDACAIDCGIDHYSLLTVKKERAKGRPKQKFVVVYYDNNGRERDGKSFSNMKDAESAAMALAMDGTESGIQKRYVYDYARCAVTYRPAERVLKSRPKKIPKGARLIEYHLYYFFGIAAE